VTNDWDQRDSWHQQRQGFATYRPPNRSGRSPVYVVAAIVIVGLAVAALIFALTSPTNAPAPISDPSLSTTDGS